MDDDLAGSLRAWRDRLDPAQAGLPRQALRRAPGLRREEVAGLAGVSVNYLTRLEQGRALNPSASVVSSLARALRLTDAEAEHLHRVTGHATPACGSMVRHLTPSVQRIMDRLGDVPVIVQDAGWTVVALNRAAAALVGDVTTERGRGRNIVWRQFNDLPSRVVRTAEEAARFEAEAVAGLHVALSRHPDDAELRSLVSDLRRTVPRFDALWRMRPAEVTTAARKTFDHPEVGLVTVDCDVLEIQCSDLRLIVYTAQPGTPDASALELICVLGVQEFAAG